MIATIRTRLSLLGELPAWAWLTIALVSTAGCDAVVGEGPIAGAIALSVGAFSYALRTRVTADARTQGAVVDALARRDRELATLGQRLDESVRRERATEDRAITLDARCDALSRELDELRRVMRLGYPTPHERHDR